MFMSSMLGHFVVFLALCFYGASFHSKVGGRLRKTPGSVMILKPR